MTTKKVCPSLYIHFFLLFCRVAIASSTSAPKIFAYSVCNSRRSTYCTPLTRHSQEVEKGKVNIKKKIRRILSILLLFFLLAHIKPRNRMSQIDMRRTAIDGKRGKNKKFSGASQRNESTTSVESFPMPISIVITFTL